MELEREIFYVKDVAKLLGVSNSALHQIIRRQDDAAKPMPKPFSIGTKKFCWHKDTIYSWLESLAAPAEAKPESADQNGN